MLTWIALCGIVAIVGIGVVTFNELVVARNRVRAAWSDLEVALQRRHDLIPRLLDLVQEYARHEQATFAAVATARAKALAANGPAERSEREAALGTRLGGLLALQEGYPALKASENFLALQRELTRTEDAIAAARQRYNAAVRAYNTALETFPDLVIARPFRFRAATFFAVQDGAPPAP